MNIERAPVGHGWLWITHGYRLIMRNPLRAVVLAMLSALGIFLALQIPVIGLPSAIILTPLLLAGYMRVCRALEYHQQVEIAYLFHGFEQRNVQLLRLGGLLLAGMILISIIVTVAGGSELAQMMDGMHATEDSRSLIDAMLAASPGVSFSLLLGIVLMLVLMLAFQFAPMLVFFDNLAPLAALRTSLSAILRNILPFTVYTLILQGITVLTALIPYHIGYIFLLPLALTSMYVSYRDIFPTPAAMDASSPAEHDVPEN